MPMFTYLCRNITYLCEYECDRMSLDSLLIRLAVTLFGLQNAHCKFIVRLAKKFDKPMPLELAGEQKNIAHAMTTMVENHLHW